MKHTNLQKNQETLRKKFINQGVRLIAPETVYFFQDTRIGKNVTIEPYVVFGKKVSIDNNSIIKSFSHIENVKIGKNVSIGPFARLPLRFILLSLAIFLRSLIFQFFNFSKSE